MIFFNEYFFIFFSSFLQSDTSVIFSCALAGKRNLSIFFVFISTFLGSFISSEILFICGKFLKKIGFVFNFFSKPYFADKSEVIIKFIKHYDTFAILLFRFLYGLKLFSPTLFGVLNFDFLHFSLYNLLGSALWAILLSMIGYSLGYFNLIGEGIGIRSVLVIVLFSIAFSLFFGRIIYTKVFKSFQINQ